MLPPGLQAPLIKKSGGRKPASKLHSPQVERYTKSHKWSGVHLRVAVRANGATRKLRGVPLHLRLFASRGVPLHFFFSMQHPLRVYFSLMVRKAGYIRL